MNGTREIAGEGRVDSLRFAEGCLYAQVCSMGNGTFVSCNSPLNPQVGSCPLPIGSSSGAARICLSNECDQCQYSRTTSLEVKANAFQRG